MLDFCLQKHFIKKGHSLFKRMDFYLFFQVSLKLHCLQWQGKFV